jgi:hypothetical protein
MDSKIGRIKKELEKLYTAVTTEGISRIDFLRTLNDYVSFFQKEEMLQKLAVAMREGSAKESIRAIQESVHDKYARDIYEYESQEGLVNNYPIFEYEQLIEFPEDFDKIKNLRTENENCWDA